MSRFYRQNVVCEQYPMLTCLSRREWHKQGAIGLVYMLHHICPKDSNLIPTNEDLRVSPAFLEKTIVKYKKKGFEFVSLDRLYEIISSTTKLDYPFVAFTIDDGYLDNYTNALPVFERQQVPFAVFVATDFVDKKAILWWDSVEELIMTRSEVVTSDGQEYPCETYQQRWDTFRLLRERILNLNQVDLIDNLNKLFSDYDIDWYEPIKRQGMSWEQVAFLANHPLCTIGGHTISHPALNKISYEEAKWEIQEGIKKIEKETSQPVNYFAYPYGTPNEIGEREYDLVSGLNIRMAFMAHQGCIGIYNSCNVTHLPRVYFKE